MSYFFRNALIIGATFSGLITVSASAVAQEQLSLTGSSCLGAGSENISSAVDQFSLNPRGLLDRNPFGGLALSNEVRTLTVSDVRVIQTLIDLAANPLSAEQASAIGAGLARAAAVCVITRPDLALQIQTAIATSGNDNIITAFGGNTLDPAPAAINQAGGNAAAGGGGAAGIGGAGSAAGITGGNTGSGAISNPSSNRLSGGGAGGSTSSSASVSPTSV